MPLKRGRQASLMKKMFHCVGLVMFLMLTAACGSQPEVDKVAVGQDAELSLPARILRTVRT
ncbi:MAG: hypothetical protein ABL961_14275 [Vicinamibacterales bacterium]